MDHIVKVILIIYVLCYGGRAFLNKSELNILNILWGLLAMAFVFFFYIIQNSLLAHEL